MPESAMRPGSAASAAGSANRGNAARQSEGKSTAWPAPRTCHLGPGAEPSEPGFSGSVQNSFRSGGSSGRYGVPAELGLVPAKAVGTKTKSHVPETPRKAQETAVDLWTAGGGYWKYEVPKEQGLGKKRKGPPQQQLEPVQAG